MGILNSIFSNPEPAPQRAPSRYFPESTNYHIYQTPPTRSSLESQYSINDNHNRSGNINLYSNENRIQVQRRGNRLVDVIHSNPDESIDETLTLIPTTRAGDVKQLIKRYMPQITIDRVYEVKNPFLKGMYEFKKAEYKSRFSCAPNEELLIHATAKDKVLSIINDNFDWRKVIRNKFGKGTSFTPDADYANCHCNRRNGDQRAFIIAKVLVYRTMITSNDTIVPPVDIDTTIGKRRGQNLVYVKYNDNEFLPIYVVYYESSNELISSSKYYETKRYSRQKNFFINNSLYSY